MQCSTVATIARMGNIHDGLVRYVDNDIVEGQTGWNICAEFSPYNGQDIRSERQWKYHFMYTYMAEVSKHQDESAESRTSSFRPL